MSWPGLVSPEGDWPPEGGSLILTHPRRLAQEVGRFASCRVCRVAAWRACSGVRRPGRGGAAGPRAGGQPGRARPRLPAGARTPIPDAGRPRPVARVVLADPAVDHAGQPRTSRGSPSFAAFDQRHPAATSGSGRTCGGPGWRRTLMAQVPATRLWCLADNHRARRFYERLGWADHRERRSRRRSSPLPAAAGVRADQTRRGHVVQRSDDSEQLGDELGGPRCAVRPRPAGSPRPRPRFATIAAARPSGSDASS